MSASGKGTGERRHNLRLSKTYSKQDSPGPSTKVATYHSSARFARAIETPYLKDVLRQPKDSSRPSNLLTLLPCLLGQQTPVRPRLFKDLLNLYVGDCRLRNLSLTPECQRFSVCISRPSTEVPAYIYLFIGQPVTLSGDSRPPLDLRLTQNPNSNLMFCPRMERYSHTLGLSVRREALMDIDI
ncbi:hypothetical protein OUZ56_030256 [Daphnia magna]|uniref:Uncharacterized protein n=1 Tax=Daphnia magna TaxID=35525 RepID=A0ABQ9ZQS0_9CRUS|nr:hypothetical protein OUZ56_030256 [Daphnia magna]